MCLPPDRDLTFLHHFEQCTLHLGRGAVDLVGQQQVGEHRPKRCVELAGLLVVNTSADQVSRHKVRCELDALEVASNGGTQALNSHCFCQARHTFDQNMASGEQTNDQPFQQQVLADDDLLDLEDHLFHQFGRGRRWRWDVARIRRGWLVGHGVS